MMDKFRLSESQRAIFQAACQLFLDNNESLLGRFSLWLTNLPRKKSGKKTLDVAEVEAIKGLSELDFQQLHTAVLLLDFMSASMEGVSLAFEELLDSMGAFDDGEYEENEFLEYRRLYLRLNRECPDSIYK